MTCRRIASGLIAAALASMLGGPTGGSAQVLRLEELNTDRIRALDRERTIVIIPGGILEQHGPYLPSYTDGYRNEAAAEHLARAVASRPGWTAVVFPAIPLGSGGANELGGRFSFAGTYAVRASTLRDVFVDLGSELGEQGFRWIFVVHLHGALSHNQALDDAGAYFRDTYGGRFVHLYGLMPVLAAGPPAPDPSDAAQNGLDVHAGRTETSALLHLRPELVDPSYAAAPSRPGETFDDLVRMAGEPDWPGYFGAPTQATAAEGRIRSELRAEAAADYMWRIVDGLDERDLPRWVDVLPESVRIIALAAADEDRARAERFARWLARRDRQ